MRRFSAALVLAALTLSALALGAVSCGTSSSGGGAPAGSITVTLNDFKFAPSTITAHAGKVSFYLENTGSAAHDMVITDSSASVVAKSDLVQPGDKSTFTVPALSAGTYKVTCDIPGHVEAGMVATLTVT